MTLLVKILILCIVTNFTIVAAISSRDNYHKRNGADLEIHDSPRRIGFIFFTCFFTGIITSVYQGVIDLHSLFSSPIGTRILDVILVYRTLLHVVARVLTLMIFFFCLPPVEPRRSTLPRTWENDLLHAQ